MKNSYILLRNNIESSSLSIEDLQQIGLQQNDLIWVECQSVCWQSPDEIAELKKLLLVEKSQPVSKKINKSAGNITETVNHYFHDHHKKKLVFVELPADKKNTPQKNVTTLDEELIADDMNKYSNPETTANIVHSKKSNPFNSHSDLPFAEIKESYIQSSAKNKNLQETVFGFELPGNIKKISLYIGLVVLGALLMLLVMNNDHKSKIVLQQLPQQPEKNIVAADPPEEEENNTPLPEIFEEQPFDQTNDHEKIKKVVQQPSIISSNTSLEKTNKTSEEMDQVTEKPTKKTPQDNELNIEKKIPIENISSKVTVKANDYNMGSFGGIKNLEVTLENGSAYLLDKIAVEINYLNPEGNIVNSDKIYFQSIGPGEAATLPVKKSKRGVKINLKVIKIDSKELSDVNSTTLDLNNYSKN